MLLKTVLIEDIEQVADGLGNQRFFHHMCQMQSIIYSPIMSQCISISLSYYPALDMKGSQHVCNLNG